MPITVNQQYDAYIPLTNATSATLSGTVPTGLSVNIDIPNQRVIISGVPTITGQAYNFTISATNTCDPTYYNTTTGAGTFSGFVVNPPPPPSPDPPPPPTQCIAFNSLYPPAGQPEVYKKSHGNYTTFLNTYGVWEAAYVGSFDRTYTFNAPISGTYTIVCSCDNIGYVYIDGAEVLQAPGFVADYSTNVFLSAGNHTVRTYGINYSGEASMATVITLPQNSGCVGYPKWGPDPLPSFDPISGFTDPGPGYDPGGAGGFGGDATGDSDGGIDGTDGSGNDGGDGGADGNAGGEGNSSGGGGGGECFKIGTLISMADGSFKKIEDILVGDMVLSADGKRINKVRYVEHSPIRGTAYKTFYAPKGITPFATENHPIVVNKKWVSSNAELSQKMYPWIETTQLEEFDTEPTNNQIVWNIWVDGDHTYQVNGFGTNSLVDDGGWLRISVEQGYMTKDQITEVTHAVSNSSSAVAYGALILSNLVATINLPLLTKYVADMMLGKKSKVPMNIAIITVGSLAMYIKKIKKYFLT